MNETALKTKVLKYLKKNYPKAWIVKISDVWYKGIPDIIICLDGVLIAIELKVKPNTPTKLQKENIKRIKLAGGKAGACYSIDDVVRIIKGGNNCL